MSTTTYVRDWTHPQLAAWEKEDLAATAWAKTEDDAYTAANEHVRLLDNAARRYRYDHETLPASERRVHEDRAYDMFNDAREAARVLRQRWPDGPPNVQWRAMETRRSQRAEQEQALRAKLAALKDCDDSLLSLADETATLAEQEAALQAQLVRINDRQAQIALLREDSREEWGEAAEAVGFTGEPTVDLPARPSGEHRAMRYERSLILGINANETDVARREAFERAAIN